MVEAMASMAANRVVLVIVVADIVADLFEEIMLLKRVEVIES